ncbi:hypothetical protein C8A00DRAFT_35168 [Chaetomidium leptoderma]|uniref:Infection structure specific protein n=1 Tax=Chaetomidium leptoderma TaxID=669021 RepID=A0AAN6VIY6_9PEZI|nr:hypothetical protein C8A00DRAFT_35168 [Chaetomidium leptoderma]
MLSQTLILTLAGVATANMAVDHMAMKRGIEERQTDEAGASACVDAMQSLITSMPTVPAAVASFAATQTETNACSITVPNSLQSAYASYTNAASSWYTAHLGDFSSAFAKCPDYATFTDDFNTPSCTDGSSSGNNGNGGSQTTGPSGSQETGSGSNSGNGNDNNNDNNNNNEPGKNEPGKNEPGKNEPGKNAGHRETGLAGAAVAIAAFLGVVALL